MISKSRSNLCWQILALVTPLFHADLFPSLSKPSKSGFQIRRAVSIMSKRTCSKLRWHTRMHAITPRSSCFYPNICRQPEGAAARRPKIYPSFNAGGHPWLDKPQSLDARWGLPSRLMALASRLYCTISRLRGESTASASTLWRRPI